MSRNALIERSRLSPAIRRFLFRRNHSFKYPFTEEVPEGFGLQNAF